MQKVNIFKTVAENFKQSRKGFFRLWLILVGIHLVSLLLGVAIYLIVLGIQVAITRIVIYWTPTRNWLVKTFDLKTGEYDTSKVSPIYKLFVNLFHSAIALLFVAIGFYIIKIGIDMLFHDGFLRQNLIYLIFFR